MDAAHRLPRAGLSEAKRERDVRLYCAAFGETPRLDQLDDPDTSALPADHLACPSKDPALTAFAQLASIRLGAQRALISLIDDQWQHVLAEATPNMSLRYNAAREFTPSGLWLGSVSVPRKWGMCKEVLDIGLTALAEGDDAVVVIDDLSQSPAHQARTYVQHDPHMRFYAAVPLTSRKGAIVGTLCVIDDKPRSRLQLEHVVYLRELAATIIEQLESCVLRDQHKRGEQLTRGLVSFADGASALRPFVDANRHPFMASGPQSPSSGATTLVNNPTDETSYHTLSTQHSSVRALQESILPTNAKTMFARAANVIRASSDLDGVLILDASVAAASNQHFGDGVADDGPTGESPTELSSGKSSASEDDHSQGKSDHSQATSNACKRCQILGFSTPLKSDATGHRANQELRSLREVDLKALFRKFPTGMVMHFDSEGDPISSTDESESTKGSLADANPSAALPKRKNRSQRVYKAIQGIIPGARTVAFVPFWDYERSRWFAGCLCWSTSRNRQLSMRGDLAYYRIFGNTIMNELARLDALASNQTKTTFLASVSHELRSPLHGILGVLEFFKNTPLDSFQVSMLNSLGACGQTLLDTINHLLDHAKINETTRNPSSKSLKNTQMIRLSSKPLKARGLSATAVQTPVLDMGIATEEVVEAMAAGQSYVTISGRQDDGLWSPAESGLSIAQAAAKRKSIYVVLDIAYEQDWLYCLPAGSWKRIVMNLFGNALKYTETGHVHVSLRSASREDGTNSIMLTVSDSGPGMSAQFLANKAFQPFSQENTHSTGTGLGLSIVRQSKRILLLVHGNSIPPSVWNIIELIGGKVEVSSDRASGTKFTVKLALSRPERAQSVDVPQRIQYLDLLPRLQGKRICILRRAKPTFGDEPDLPQNLEGLTHFTDALASTLTTCFKMEVVQTSEWEQHNADIVIFPEPSFAHLVAIRSQRTVEQKAPVTIFVAMDAIEADALRNDARVLSKESVVEIVTQPCGPCKLASVLNRCFDRYQSPEENILLPPSTTTSPQPALPTRTRSPLLISPDPIHSTRPTERHSTLLSPQPLSEHYKLDNDPGNIPPDIPDGGIILEENPGAPDVERTDFEPTSLLPPAKKVQEGHVLIVDDNTINRKILGAFMKRNKLPYQDAENGLQALLAYRDGPVRFDIILMDISMPVMDGMSAARAIRDYEQANNVERCFIVAITGLTSGNSKLEAWSAGIDHYMTKPVNFKELDGLLQKDRKEKQDLAADEAKPLKALVD